MGMYLQRKGGLESTSYSHRHRDILKFVDSDGGMQPDFRLHPFFLFSPEYSFPAALHHQSFTFECIPTYLKTNLFLEGHVEFGFTISYSLAQA